MRVRSRQHVSVRVPHKFGNDKRVQAFLKRIRRKSVPEVGETVSLLKLFLDRVEATAHGHCGPWFAACVAEQDAAGVATYPLPGECKRSVSQVNDSWPFSAFRFLCRKHPTPVSKVDVSGVDSQQFLRSGASFSCEVQQVAESWVARRCENRIELGVGNNLLASACRGLSKSLDRRAVDVALTGCPIERGFDGSARIAFAAGGP